MTNASRNLLVYAVLLPLTLLLLLLQIGTGEYAISIEDTFASLLGYGTGEYDFVVRTLRVPRALIGWLAGASLAVSGTLLQGITRNPLASPGVVGLNAGAGLAAVVVIVWLDVSRDWLPALAFAGALIVAALSYALAWRRGVSTTRMVLIGIGIAFVCDAVISIALLDGNIRKVNQATIWMVGSLYERSWEHFWPLLPWAAVFLPLAWLGARSLDVIGLGDETSTGLGNRIHRSRTRLLFVAVALAGSTVATVGTIGFVGLMAPHLARRIVGTRHRTLIPVAALLGGIIVLAADFAGRTLLAPTEIPCGLLTALLGGPYMVYLLLRDPK